MLPGLGVDTKDPAAKLGCHRVQVLHPLPDSLLVVGEPPGVPRGISVTGQLDNVRAGGLVGAARDRVDDGVEGHADGNDEGPVLELREPCDVSAWYCRGWPP